MESKNIKQQKNKKHMRTEDQKKIIGILGGTGKQGRGLALRFAKAGFMVQIGSRTMEKAKNIAEQLNHKLGSTLIQGFTNQIVARSSDYLLVTLPFHGRKEIIEAIKQEIRSNTIIIDVTNALVFNHGRPHVDFSVKSASEELQGWLPDKKVISGFTTIGSRVLEDLDHDLQSTVLLTGDKNACMEFAKAVQRIPGLTPVFAGDLSYSKYLEGIAALSINIEIINKTRVNGIVLLTERK